MTRRLSKSGPLPPKPPAQPPFLTCLWRMLLPIAAATAVGFLFNSLQFNIANIITVYILGVLLSALWVGGYLWGVAASILSVLAFNFFFTVPRISFRFEDKSYLVTFPIMLTASFITSTLAQRVKTQSYAVSQRAYAASVLLETSQKLQGAGTRDEILTALGGQILRLLNGSVALYPVEKGTLQQPLLMPADAAAPSKDAHAAALWVYLHKQEAGLGSQELPGVEGLYLPIQGKDDVFAVACVMPAHTENGNLRAPDSFEKNLLLAMTAECGLALEKTALSEEKRLAELSAQKESLRSNLLRAISHDLRTPLTSISGSAGILMERSQALTEDKKQRLYTDIYDDAHWLINLVENLLSVTRIENGTMEIRHEPELVEDVLRDALRHVDRQASLHHLSVDVPDGLLMADMDARLISQVLINLVNNAVKYTPEGTSIALSARACGSMVELRVADNGPGVPDSAKERLFEMFYTASGAVRGDSRRGLGLGLALCRSIVAAHGGTIHVEDNHPHGAIFVFTLPRTEVTAYEQTADPGD